MQPSEYFGLVYKVEFSQATDGTGFQEIGKCYDVATSNDSNEVTRNWTDGSSQKWMTGFTHGIEFRVSKTTADNLGVAVPQNVYAASDAIDGVTGVTAGAGGAIQIGEQIEGKSASMGILKLTPLDTLQQPIYAFNATATLKDMALDDGLGEVTVSVSAEKLIKGTLTFA